MLHFWPSLYSKLQLKNCTWFKHCALENEILILQVHSLHEIVPLLPSLDQTNTFLFSRWRPVLSQSCVWWVSCSWFFGWHIVVSCWYPWQQCQGLLTMSYFFFFCFNHQHRHCQPGCRFHQCHYSHRCLINNHNDTLYLQYLELFTSISIERRGSLQRQ